MHLRSVFALTKRTASGIGLQFKFACFNDCRLAVPGPPLSACSYLSRDLTGATVMVSHAVVAAELSHGFGEDLRVKARTAAELLFVISVIEIELWDAAGDWTLLFRSLAFPTVAVIVWRSAATFVHSARRDWKEGTGCCPTRAFADRHERGEGLVCLLGWNGIAGRLAARGCSAAPR